MCLRMQNLYATVPMFEPLMVILFFYIYLQNFLFLQLVDLAFFVLSLCTCKAPHLLYSLSLSDCREHYVHLHSFIVQVYLNGCNLASAVCLPSPNSPVVCGELTSVSTVCLALGSPKLDCKYG